MYIIIFEDGMVMKTNTLLQVNLLCIIAEAFGDEIAVIIEL